jgi:hypothetical protein
MIGLGCETKVQARTLRVVEIVAFRPSAEAFAPPSRSVDEVDRKIILSIFKRLCYDYMSGIMSKI